MLNDLQSTFLPEQNQEWSDNDEALEVLDRFCLVLNYHFQGDPVEIDMPDLW